MRRHPLRLPALLGGILLSVSLSLSLSVPASESSEDMAFGSRAYSHLETISANLPQRTNEENTRSESLNTAGEWIAQELASYGYEVNRQDYTHLNYTGVNYSVTKPGTTNETVVIGAHYDCVDTAGIDDNGSGVSVLLELAERFHDIETPCTLNFVFYDNEEHGGYVGSYNYVQGVLAADGVLSDVILNINLDSIGAGDRLYAYGGEYDEDKNLTKDWGYRFAKDTASELGIDLYTMPKAVENCPDPEIAFVTPTRPRGSDHYYFRESGIPYVYFEATLWCNDDGSGGNDETILTCHYQTANPAFESTGGQIMHTAFDNLETLNTLLPGRLQSNMSHAAEIVYTMLATISPDTMDAYEYPQTPETTAPVETEAETETEVETEVFRETEAATQEDVMTVEVVLSRHKPVVFIFCLAAALIIALIAYVIVISLNGRPRRRKNPKKKKKTKL